jgi:ABC-type transport system involved in multi-copper enzyme maturation permease subunit
MSSLRSIATLTRLTLHEAMRRRILLAALICGGAFLILFTGGLNAILSGTRDHAHMTLIERRVMVNMLTLAGLYAVNFLVVMTSVLLPVDTLSGEIQSGVIQTLASKPIRRSEIVLGKWLGHWLIMAAYLGLLAGGVLAIVRLMGHFTPPDIAIGIPLMLLEGTVLLTLSIAGGAKLSTVTNGIMAFGLYGLAFIGSWVEQIGAITGHDNARYVGTLASLIMPSEALWQLAAYHMQPSMLRQLAATPFSPASVPSVAMVIWAAAYVAVALAIGVRAFQKRPL